MISKISIKNIASYGETPAVLETDKKINLVYGLNGTGKTTLSNYLQDKDNDCFSCCSISGLSNEKVLVYNHKFVTDNFYQDTQRGIFSLKSENKAAKEKIDIATQEINKLKNQIKNDELKTGSQFDLEKKQEDIDILQTSSEEKTWKIKNDYYGGDRILEFCLDGKMGSKKSLFDFICKLQKLDNKPQKSIEILKKEAEATQGENAKSYDESLVKKVNFDFWNIENQEIFKEVIIGNENSQVAKLINKLNNSDWVKKGKEFLNEPKEENEICPFCQQKTITKDLHQEIQDYFDETYQNKITSLEKEKEYDEEYQEYTQFFTEIGTLEEGNEDEKIKKQLDRMGLRYGSPERAAKEAEIKWAMSSYRGATTDEEKKTANEEGLKLLEKPSRKMIGDVAPDVRVWIRAMADQELDEMYKFDPKMVADRNLTTTIRSSAVIYGRKSENIASIDKDGFRDAKLSTIIDAEDLVNGIGELAPSFETFRHMLDNMTANGAKEVEALKRMTAAEYTKFQGGNNRDAWEKLKEDYLRKAVKKIAFEKGTYQDYVSGFNAEQRGLAQLGDEKMIESIGGQSADEFPILRGLRWRNPAFAKYMTRQIAKEFRQKDTGDIKEVMDMVLFDFKKMLDTGGTFKISDANMDLLHWVATESQGKEFKNRDLVNPELQEYFDKMLAIFGEMGRNTNPTYEAFDTAKKKLKY
jgi:hypothetical protein